MAEPPTTADVAGTDPAGPIEYLILEFPAGRIPADAFHQLLELARADRIRILDPEFVARRWPRQTAALPPVAPGRDTTGVIAQLRELGELRDAGVLSSSEFQVQKERVLYG